MEVTKMLKIVSKKIQISWQDDKKHILDELNYNMISSLITDNQAISGDLWQINHKTNQEYFGKWEIAN
jgi:hypothetical protein